ncbi:amidase domain-containing protein [Tissierella pigra]|uniref:Putative amidase domain-containing protein n=1 Tax=Tissierella pigra TaxID=2607614 RepID=A0A6N7Y2X7_9FIRM|nr:amidase domain-containing protein [Tissierella pigra]MSU03224.1 hypothetical protein [Tissierella pigra]
MFKKRRLSFLVAMLLILSFIPTAFASANNYNFTSISRENEEAIITYVCDQVIESYAEYYTIPSISGQIVSLITESDGIHATVDVGFKKILLAKSASELPYIKGLESELANITDDNSNLLAKEQIDARKKDLDDNYIGKEQEENATFKVIIPIAKDGFSIEESTNVEICFQSETGEMNMSDFAPASESELFNKGVEEIDSILKSTDIERYVEIAAKTNPSSAKDYDRIKARGYVRDYSCGKCTTSPHACRNKNYPFYNGNDCANFVSQAIHAGGIATESNWKSGTNTWVNTGYSSSIYGLKDYMVDQGFFFASSNKNKAMAGSIIYWTSYSHVGLVDQNDTVTMTFCAHTNDRKSSSFKNISDVSFYIPVWDSYGGVWTPQN